MSMFSISFVAAMISVQPTEHRSIAHDLIEADPFAIYIVMSDDELRAARGGMLVGNEYVDIAIGGWLLTVARGATDIVGHSLPNGVAGAPGDQLFAMSTNAREIVINNMLNGVHISETRNFNIVINNLDQVMNDGAAAGALARAANDAFILNGPR
ncbi:MAG: hypothetical protein GC152_13555 [Alphaproteobacteria bacterium]|nr:hypothetical protein [Alphaproteobacteria bacterium]